MKILTTVLFSSFVLVTPACDDGPVARPRSIAPAPSTTPVSPWKPGAGPDASAPACEKTLCDLKAENCTNPPERDYCGECWSICKSNLDIAVSCAESCNELCKRRGPKVDVCQQRLAACRHTPDNAVCVDGIDQPTDGRPCGDVASKVSCAVADDVEAQRAIYAASPKCEACDDEWIGRCLDATCRDEASRFAKCVERAGCADGFLCERCDKERKAYSRCFWDTMDDPKDVGGCNSGSHRCWTKPICNDDGTAR